MVARISARQRQQEAYAYLGIAQSEYDAQNAGRTNNNNNFTDNDLGIFNDALIKQGISFIKDFLLESAGDNMPAEPIQNNAGAVADGADAAAGDVKMDAMIAKLMKDLMSMGLTEDQAKAIIAQCQTEANEANEMIQTDSETILENTDQMYEDIEVIENDNAELEKLNNSENNSYLSGPSGREFTLSNDNNNNSGGAFTWNPNAAINGQGSDNNLPQNEGDGNNPEVKRLQQEIKTTQDDLNNRGNENQNLTQNIDKNIGREGELLEKSENTSTNLQQQRTTIDNNSQKIDDEHTDQQEKITKRQQKAEKRLKKGTGHVGKATKKIARGTTGVSVGTTVATVNPPLGGKSIAKGTTYIGKGTAAMPPSTSAVALSGGNVAKSLASFGKNIAAWGIETTSNAVISSLNGENFDSNATLQSLLSTSMSSGMDILGGAISGLGSNRNDHELLHKK